MLTKPVVHKIRMVSPVWIVPLVALAIALWLAVSARMEKGTEIEIMFADATDIIAGQTLIKLKNVEVGVVKKVRLSKDLKSVRVIAEIDRDVSKHLGIHTRFWIVTPKISATGVSNLGTLISGVYLVMDPGEDGPYTTNFVGLTEPPAFESDEPGSQYVLQAEDLGSLDIGSPIHYKQIRVGEVTGYKLADSREYVDINIFIKAPYDELVQTKSRFWNVSGVGVSIGADGVKAQMASLASLINGGIEFDTAAGFEVAELAESGHRFQLHPDKDSVIEGRYNIKYYYLLKFSESVKGLTVGAPVEFKGIKVGEVVDVILDSAENIDKSLHVYITLEPQRFDPDATPTREEADARVNELVKQGLRATMKTASLITGSRIIDLSYADDVAASEIVRGDNYSEIPTLDDPMNQMIKQLTAVVEKVGAIPFDDIGNNLNGSLASLNNILSTLEQKGTAEKLDGTVQNLEATLKSADAALQEMSAAMRSVDQAIAPDSELKYELTNMLKSVGDAASSLQLFLDELNRHPNSLISGSKKDN